MKDLTPGLKAEIAKYFEGGRDIPTLTLLCQQAFGLSLNTKCSACIYDAEQALKKLIKPKNSTMNYKWTADKRYELATVNLRVNHQNVIVNKNNLNDTYAAMISRIPKYAHLVEGAEPVKPLEPIKLGGGIKEGNDSVELNNAVDSFKSDNLMGFTSTENVTPKEENQPKRRGRKPKQK